MFLLLKEVINNEFEDDLLPKNNDIDDGDDNSDIPDISDTTDATGISSMSPTSSAVRKPGNSKITTTSNAVPNAALNSKTENKVIGKGQGTTGTIRSWLSQC